MRVAYLDCFSGASGDMLLGALLDSGLSLPELTDQLSSLDLPDFRLSFSSIDKGGLRSGRVELDLPQEHHHRHFSDIKQMLSRSRLPQPVIEQATAVFLRLAQAESKIHQLPVERIHFHEVGAADSIIDIVGTVLGFHLLGVEKIFFSPLPVGQGPIRCAHGTLPNPAPATTELLRGLPLIPTDLPGELVTPTAAALLAELGQPASCCPPLTLTTVGYGAGSRDLPQPNVLRLWLGDAADSAPVNEWREEWVWLIETALDDINPEWLPWLRARLEEAGAIDLWWTPVQMKKGRPGLELTALASEASLPQCLRQLMEHSTTLGIRVRKEKRYSLPRQEITVDTPLGPIRAKSSLVRPGAAPRLKPEYESCRAIAEHRGLPLAEVYAAFWASASTRSAPEE